MEYWMGIFLSNGKKGNKLISRCITLFERDSNGRHRCADAFGCFGNIETPLITPMAYRKRQLQLMTKFKMNCRKAQSIIQIWKQLSVWQYRNAIEHLNGIQKETAAIDDKIQDDLQEVSEHNPDLEAIITAGQLELENQSLAFGL
jgi:hypothetical protein